MVEKERQQRLQAEADQAKPVAEADKMRTALLAAVSRDLRTPLAAAKAAVESLRSHDITWTPEDHDERYRTPPIPLPHHLQDRYGRSPAYLGCPLVRPQGGAG
ncbi:histidine kinase [Nonomuraea turcica]|uniref:hypothetical protein n=1 Tax=Nonomuraea sp. G32 TaxID=3067274 RepID=UPI00273B2238|nr:hypothetical protein [Nonomuraea sp. G32]MDP4510167.1 hypothetical protein [Nonomuraea sp. G32]